MITRLKVLLTALAVCVVATGSATAAGLAGAKPAPKLAIQLGAPFCDNAILQREMPVPVWGWASRVLVTRKSWR